MNSEPKTLDTQTKLPYVTICTPTYNRHNYFKRLMKMVHYQDYPKELIQWVVVDDGDDTVEDLVKNLTYVTYIHIKDKTALGKKRNISNEQAKGDIIVYMDDDDLYPHTRVSHAVQQLMINPHILCAGCSKLYVLFEKKGEIRRFGPYHDNHATANTFAFKKELLNITQFDDDAMKSEEKKFLNNFSMRLVQLDPLKTILAVSHETNTFDKKLIINSSKKSKKNMCDFSEKFEQLLSLS